MSGYRGSPLGGLDQTLGEQRQHLTAADIVFEPGINEDLAATAVWGTQQLAVMGDAKFDGVFSLWYGKGLAEFAAGRAELDGGGGEVGLHREPGR